MPETSDIGNGSRGWIRSVDITVAQEDAVDLSETYDRLVRFGRRRRWWLLASTCGTTLVSIAALLALPNQYASEATLLVVKQQVPERYVTPTITTDLLSALDGMTQQVLSRGRLLAIMNTYGLYVKERQRLAPEQVVALMRRNINIEPVEVNPANRDFNAFKISFTSDDAHLAQAVASRLTSLFIQENLKTREDQASTTSNFLRAELVSAKSKLDQQEQRLRDFKMRSLGELPEQQQENVQILVGLQTQLQNTMIGLNRAQQHRLYLESLVRDDLTRLVAERRALLATYTLKHPRVAKIDQEIVNKQALLISPSPRIPGTSTSQILGATPGSLEDEASVDPLRSQLEANRLEIEGLSNDQKQLRADIAQCQQRLSLTPVREQQLAGILRDYNLLKQNYADLLGKEQQSQLAMSLEKREEGQQIRLVDPPNLPTIPSNPKRMKLSFCAAAAGLFVGLALAFLLEIRDHSLWTEKDISRHFTIPLVLGLPLIELPFERRSRAWRRAFEYLAGTVLVMAVAAAEFYVYRRS